MSDACKQADRPSETRRHHKEDKCSDAAKQVDRRNMVQSHQVSPHSAHTCSLGRAGRYVCKQAGNGDKKALRNRHQMSDTGKQASRQWRQEGIKKQTSSVRHRQASRETKLDKKASSDTFYSSPSLCLSQINNYDNITRPFG